MRRTLLVLILLLIGFQFMEAEAQNKDEPIYHNYPIDSAKVIVKIDIISGLAAYSNLPLSVEYRIKPNFYIQHTVGYILGHNNYSFRNPDLESPKGWNLRTEPRFYLSYKRSANRGFYLAPEIAYRYIFDEIEHQNIESCGLDCSFIRLVDFKAIRHDIALNFKIGIQKVYKGKIALDYSIGFGPKYIWHEADVPKDADSNSPFLSREDEFKHNITIGFKVGYLLK